MSEMKSWTIYSKDGHQQFDLSPFDKEDTAWLEVSNSQDSGFFVLSKEAARQIAEKLMEWANDE